MPAELVFIPFEIDRFVEKLEAAGRSFDDMAIPLTDVAIEMEAEIRGRISAHGGDAKWKPHAAATVKRWGPHQLLVLGKPASKNEAHVSLSGTIGHKVFNSAAIVYTEGPHAILMEKGRERGWSEGVKRNLRKRRERTKSPGLMEMPPRPAFYLSEQMQQRGVEICIDFFFRVFNE